MTRMIWLCTIPVLMFGLVFTTSGFAEEGSDYGGGTRYLTRVTRQSECNELLKSVDYKERLKLPYANKIAARTLLFLTLEHPEIVASVNEPNQSKDDLLGLYYGIVGFGIRPRPVKTGLFSKDPTGYSRFVKALGWNSSVWKTKGLAPNFEKDQILIDKLRDQSVYHLVDKKTIQNLAEKLLEQSVRAWNRFESQARPRYNHKGEDSRKEWIPQFELSETEIKVETKSIQPFSENLATELRNLVDVLYPKSRPAITASFRLINWDANADFQERWDVARKARQLVVDFLINFFPSILQVRDEILEDYYRNGNLAQALVSNRELRSRIREEILKLGRGEELPFQAQEEVLPLDLPSDLSGKELQRMNIDSLKQNLDKWEREAASSPLQKTRKLLPLLDAAVDVLPKGFTFEKLEKVLPLNSNLTSHANQLQTYFHTLAESARENFEKLSTIHDLLMDPIETQVTETSKWLDDNEKQLDSLNERKLVEYEEAYLVRTNLLQARGVLQTHLELQARRLSLFNRLQTLLRQYRQDLAVNDPSVSDSAATILGLIHLLSEEGSPRVSQ